MKVYIYGLIDPRTDEVRYVGKSKDPRERLWSHTNPSRLDKRFSTYKDNWLKSLAKAGVRPRMLILEETDDAHWAERECFWIAKYRRSGARLTNVAEGGKGCIGLKRGPLSPEHVEKMRRAASGRRPSAETRGRMSLAQKQRLQSEAERVKLLRASQAARGKQPCKLSDTNAIAAANRVLAGESLTDVSSSYGVSLACISDIVHGRSRRALGLIPLKGDMRAGRSIEARRGSKHPLAKLTEDDVRIIHAELADGTTQRVLAKRFDVCAMTISKIHRRVIWAHVL